MPIDKKKLMNSTLFFTFAKIYTGWKWHPYKNHTQSLLIISASGNTSPCFTELSFTDLGGSWTSWAGYGFGGIKRNLSVGLI